MTFVLRTAGDPLSAIAQVRETIKSIDANLPVADVRTLQNIADGALARPRFTTALLGLFAALALGLATIGIYGVIALLVTRRRQEIGIRMALGARRGTILKMVVGRGMTLAGLGVVLGLAGAVALTGTVSGMLYGVSRLDPLTFLAAPVTLAGVALLACLIPAVRASRLDPLAALRD
jgi:ABC-type antimicrobial peptide transport system permease subunit